MRQYALNGCAVGDPERPPTLVQRPDVSEVTTWI
jgi:hypothetical protein